MALSISFVASDEFRVVAGSGWVILENGNRIDWPMLSTRDEAENDLRGLRRAYRELASDEASEAHGLRLMSAIS